jgi:DNA transformation protein and related proteins
MSTRTAPAPTPPFVLHGLELLGSLGAVRARRMFGGWAFHAGEVMVALIAFDRLYLKADEASRGAFAAAGGEPFVYDGKGRLVTMSYCTVPAEAMDSPALMAPWARLALQAALRAAAGREGAGAAAPKSTRSARSARPARAAKGAAAAGLRRRASGR